MSAIDWITIRGFKCLARIEHLSLRQINVLIGANGSGKSNFIESFALLRAIANGGLRRYVGKAGGADGLLHFGRKTTDHIVIHCFLGDALLLYEVELSPSQSDDLYISSEVATTHEADSKGQHFVTRHTLRNVETGINDLTDNNLTIKLERVHLDNLRVYHFNDSSWLSPMKKTADVHDNRYLHADGSNLAAFLYLVKLRHSRSYKSIRSAIRLAAPFFDDFHLAPALVNENTIRLRWKHRGSDVLSDVSSLSDGTLRFIAIATLLLLPEALRPPIIIIDEPELGLHPVAINLLAELVKSASIETQIILATQSPALLDYFDPEDVLVADRKHGATTISRLDSEELEDWLEDYSLSQLWENNEFGGRPIPESVQ